MCLAPWFDAPLPLRSSVQPLHCPLLLPFSSANGFSCDLPCLPLGFYPIHITTLCMPALLPGGVRALFSVLHLILETRSKTDYQPASVFNRTLTPPRTSPILSPIRTPLIGTFIQHAARFVWIAPRISCKYKSTLPPRVPRLPIYKWQRDRRQRERRDNIHKWETAERPTSWQKFIPAYFFPLWERFKDGAHSATSAIAIATYPVVIVVTDSRLQ